MKTTRLTLKCKYLIKTGKPKMASHDQCFVTAAPQKCYHVTSIFKLHTKTNGL